MPGKPNAAEKGAAAKGTAAAKKASDTTAKAHPVKSPAPAKGKTRKGVQAVQAAAQKPSGPAVTVKQAGSKAPGGSKASGSGKDKQAQKCTAKTSAKVSFAHEDSRQCLLVTWMHILERKSLKAGSPAMQRSVLTDAFFHRALAAILARGSRRQTLHSRPPRRHGGDDAGAVSTASHCAELPESQHVAAILTITHCVRVAGALPTRLVTCCTEFMILRAEEVLLWGVYALRCRVH